MELRQVKDLTQSLITQIRVLTQAPSLRKLDEFQNRLLMVEDLLQNTESLTSNRAYYMTVYKHYSQAGHLVGGLHNMLNGSPEGQPLYWSEWCVKIEDQLQLGLELLNFAPSPPPKKVAAKGESSPRAKNVNRLKKSALVNRQVFVVHGHDEAMKEAVARTLGQLNLEPIVLHEQPNLGRTIIEKFSDYADVSFAVVLLSGDDVAHSKNTGEQNKRPRARQNVIFELGYFIGKLGRDRVMALYKEEPNFEIPSDYSGVLFVPFDAGGRWKFDLVRELQSCGLKVDANKLIK